MKKQTDITNAEHALEAARQGLALAEQQHAAALASKTDAEAKSLEDGVDIDRAVRQLGEASIRIEVAERRLGIAQERVAKAEKAVQSASVDAVKAELTTAEEQVAQVDADVLALVRSTLATIAEAICNLHEKAHARNALVSKLGQLGAPVPAAKHGPVLRSLVVSSPSDTAIRAAIREGKRFDGPTIDGIGSLQAVLKYIAAEPARELEAKLNAEAVVRGREAQRHADALAGLLGEAEQDAALERNRAFWPNLADPNGTPVHRAATDIFAEEV